VSAECTLSGVFTLLMLQDFKFMNSFSKRTENAGTFDAPFHVLHRSQDFPFSAAHVQSIAIDIL
jgi:hypothetical protein